MSNEEVTVGGGAAAQRRTPRQGVGGSPVGSTFSIVLAVIAVVAGFLILRNVTGEESIADGGTGPDITLPGNGTTTTTFDAGLATTIPETTTSTIAFITEGATVVVANGNTTGGSAGRMTETLAAAGFNMADPVNAASNVEDSVVYFDPGTAQAEAVANSVARALGGVAVTAVTTPAPTTNGTLGDAGVLVVLGNKQADKTIVQLSETAGVETPATGTSPAVSGGDVVAPEEPATTDATDATDG